MPSRTGVPGVLEEPAGVLALGAVIVVANFILLLSVGGEGTDLGLGLASIFFLLLAAQAEHTDRLRSMVPKRIVTLMVVGGAMAAIGIGSFYGLTAGYSPIGCAVLVLGGANMMVTAVRAVVLRRDAGRTQRA